MKDSIRLSPKHGVNPSLMQCFYCLKDYGVALFGKIGGKDEEAPHKVCFGPGSEPCDDCKKHMDQGIILISVDESKTDDPKNPYRTGGWAVVREEMICRVFGGQMAENVCKSRVAFLEDEAWDMIGLPR